MYNCVVPTSDLLQLIGQTPLVELKRLSPKPGIRIFAKLEGQNPSGSVKDRIALALVEAAERRGALRPGATIVEASSGNTALALAFVAKQKGYQARVVLPRGIAPNIGDLLALSGVRITWVDAVGGMKVAIDTARELAAAGECVPLGQFTEAANVQAHYQTTGVEIAAALDQIDYFVAGIGTGGTIMGVGRRLRESNPEVKLIGIEPKLGERLQGLRNLQEGFIPPLLDLAFLDGRFMVDAASAFACAQDVARLEGIFGGASAGAAVHVAQRLAERVERANIVLMFADAGWKYLPARPWRAAQRQSQNLDNIHWW